MSVQKMLEDEINNFRPTNKSGSKLRTKLEKISTALASGANPNGTTPLSSPLINAIENNIPIEIIKILLEYGADPNIIKNNKSVLRVLLDDDVDFSMELIEILKMHKFDINNLPSRREFIDSLKILLSNPEKFEIFAKNGFNIFNGSIEDIREVFKDYSRQFIRLSLVRINKLFNILLDNYPVTPFGDSMATFLWRITSGEIKKSFYQLLKDRNFQDLYIPGDDGRTLAHVIATSNDNINTEYPEFVIQLQSVGSMKKNILGRTPLQLYTLKKKQKNNNSGRLIQREKWPFIEQPYNPFAGGNKKTRKTRRTRRTRK